MTPESQGRELADLMRAPAAEADFELRGDPGVVTAILDPDRHVALVRMAGGVVLPVPYGVGAPLVGRQYLVESTPQGDRWLKAAPAAWCKIWTLDAEWNEEGAVFADDMLDPASGDELRLPTGAPFGNGADGAAVHNLDGGDVDLGSTSICGRLYPDAVWDTFDSWSPEPGPGGGMGGYVGPRHGIPAGLVVGDEFILYLAQVKHTGGDALTGFIGRWETHRVSALDTFVHYDDYFLAIPAGFHDMICYIQRVPNYTTIGQSGSLNTSAITCGYHDATTAETGATPPAGAGTGVVFVRASVQSAARFTAVAKGFEGGAAGVHCVDLGAAGWWEHGNPGHGMRVPNGASGDGGTGKFGGGGAGQSADCLTSPTNAAHVASTGHNADTSTAGAGGGHAAPGSVPVDNTRHRRAGILGPYDYAGRPPGNASIAIGQAKLTSGGLYGRACFGGGGGSGGDYHFGGSDSYSGPGGAGGGFVAVCAASVQANNGVGFTIPTVDVNGTDGAFTSGGGAGGSILIYADTLGSAIALDPWLMAETVTIAGANTGRSGAGGGTISNADAVIEAPGNGAVGRVHVLYGTNNGYAANGSVTAAPSTSVSFAGCWSSAIFDGIAIGRPAGTELLPDTLTADWLLDSDAVIPTFYLEGGDMPDLSDATRYPPVVSLAAVDGEPLDLTPYGLAPAKYWRVTACLDGGPTLSDTPRILSVELCGA